MYGGRSPDRSRLLQLVTQGGHGPLHALVLLPLTLQHGRLGLHLLDYFVQHPAHTFGLLLLQLKPCLALHVRVVQLHMARRGGEDSRGGIGLMVFAKGSINAAVQLNVNID